MDADRIVLNIAFGLVLGGSVGLGLGHIQCNYEWHRTLIERNIAEYNSQTGEWQYKQEFRLEGEE